MISTTTPAERRHRATALQPSHSAPGRPVSVETASDMAEPRPHAGFRTPFVAHFTDETLAYFEALLDTDGWTGDVIDLLDRWTNDMGEITPEVVQAADSALSTHRLRAKTGGTAETETEFEEFRPLDASYCETPFPVDVLPPAIRDKVMAVAESVAVPLDMAAILGLGALATLSKGRIRTFLSMDYFEPSNIYVAAVAEPGERKSAAFGHMYRPVYDIENRTNQLNMAAIRASEARLTALQAAIDNATSAIRKAKPGADFYALQADLVAAREAFANYKPTLAERYVTDDATPEALVSLMADNKGSIAIASAEGGVFNDMARYNDKPNFGPYLKGHAGDPIRVDRKGRDPEQIEYPALTMALAFQPAILQEIGRRDDYRGLGLLARFLYALPKPRVGTRRLNGTTIPEHVEASYQAALEAFAAAAREAAIHDRYIDLSLTHDAQVAFRVFHDEIEERQALGQDLKGIADWASKLPGATLRIAGLLHVLLDGKDMQLIPGSTMNAAITVARYFLDHAQVAFDVMGGIQADADAQKLLDIVLRTNTFTVSARDLQRKMNNWKRDRLGAAVVLLVDHGYARIEERKGRSDLIHFRDDLRARMEV